MTKVKICCLRRAEDIVFANELMPDYVGFVFAKASKRYVLPEEAKKLKWMLNPNICAVGVFVNEPMERMLALIESGMIEAIQLHGAETVRIATSEDVRLAEQSAADFILLDHGGGGTGESFDWSLLDGIKRPFFLAGGLSAENAGEAIARYKPYAVDSSSKLETDGVKDYKKMKAFVEAVRQNG